MHRLIQLASLILMICAFCRTALATGEAVWGNKETAVNWMTTFKDLISKHDAFSQKQLVGIFSACDSVMEVYENYPAKSETLNTAFASGIGRSMAFDEDGTPPSDLIRAVRECVANACQLTFGDVDEGFVKDIERQLRSTIRQKIADFAAETNAGSDLEIDRADTEKCGLKRNVITSNSISEAANNADGTVADSGLTDSNAKLIYGIEPRFALQPDTMNAANWETWSSSGPSRISRVNKRDAPVFGAQPRIGGREAIDLGVAPGFPGSGYGRNYNVQDTVGNQNNNKRDSTSAGTGAIAMSSASGFRAQNGALNYENRFPYSSIFPNTGSMNFDNKGINQRGLINPVNKPSVSKDADKRFLGGLVPRFDSGFQNWNLRNANTDLTQMGSIWPINPSRNIDRSVKASSDGSIEEFAAAVAKFPSAESDVVGSVLSSVEGIQTDDLVEDLGGSLGDPTDLIIPLAGGRKRTGRRRLGDGRKNNRVTKVDIQTTVQPEEDQSNDDASEETLSEVTAPVSVEDDATTEVFEDVTTDGSLQITNVTMMPQQQLDDVSVTSDEGVSSFMDTTADRLCLSPAAEDMQMVLSSLVSNGSVDMTPLPEVISSLVSNVRESYPELSSGEVTTQVFGELCTALLHILPRSTVGDVSYHTIPETAQIVSLMLQSGLD